MQTPALPSYDFTGQVALVTGASSGMGLATARAFASQGASVTLADIDATRLRTVTDKLVEAGHPVEGVVCDVADEDQVRQRRARLARAELVVWVEQETLEPLRVRRTSLGNGLLEDQQVPVTLTLDIRIRDERRELPTVLATPSEDALQVVHPDLVAPDHAREHVTWYCQVVIVST